MWSRKAIRLYTRDEMELAYRVGRANELMRQHGIRESSHAMTITSFGAVIERLGPGRRP